MNLLLKVSLPGFMDKLFPNLSSAVQGMIFVAATLMIIFIAAVVVFVLYRKAVIRRARAPRTMEKAYYRTVEVIVPSSQAALNEQKEELDIITPPLVFESAAVHPGSESASAAEDSQNTAGPVVRLSAALLNLKKLILAAKLIEREVFADDAAIDQCGRMIETQSALEAEARSKLKAERGLEERALLVKQADEIAQNIAAERETIQTIEARKAEKTAKFNEEAEEVRQFIAENSISRGDILLVEGHVAAELDKLASGAQLAAPDSGTGANEPAGFLARVASYMADGTESEHEAGQKMELLRLEAERAELYARLAQQAAKAAVMEAQAASEENKLARRAAARDAINRANEAGRVAQVLYGYLVKSQVSLDRRLS